MKKQITTTIVIAFLAGVLTTGCNKDNKVDENIVQNDNKVDENIVQNDNKVDENIDQNDNKVDENIDPNDYKVGENITFGHYEQDNNTSNGKEPITWRILDKNSSGQYLIISEKVLDNKPYNAESTDITWEESTLRSWLNGSFIDTAFSEEEKAGFAIHQYGILTPALPKRKLLPHEPLTDEEKKLGVAMLEILHNDALRERLRLRSLERAKYYRAENIMALWDSIVY